MNRKKTIQTNKPNNKRLLLVLLVGFILGIVIMHMIIPNICDGCCHGGWANPRVEKIEPPISHWFYLISGLVFSGFCGALWFFVKSRYLKWIPVSAFALCYLGLIYYGYFVLSTIPCLELMCC